EGVSLTRADRGHLHHKLQYLGFTHRQSVILLYFMAALFAIASVILYLSTITGAVLICLLLILSVVIIVEATDLIGTNRRPILRFVKRMFIYMSRLTSVLSAISTSEVVIVNVSLVIFCSSLSTLSTFSSGIMRS